MTINAHQAGDLVRVTAAFTDPADDTPVDPDDVLLDVRKGDGSTATHAFSTSPATVVKDSVGNYHADLDTTGLAGTWHYRWYSTGAGQAAEHNVFTVEPSPI